MPFVDVTDLLFDPDIAGQRFTVIRRQETVNNYGESTWTHVQAPAIGSVQPEGDNDLDRGDAMDAMPKTIIVVTTFRLRGPSKGPSATRFKPDLIQWGSPPNLYIVTSLKSWGSFGRGMVEATATTIPWTDYPPGLVPPFIPRLDFSKNYDSFYMFAASGGYGC